MKYEELGWEKIVVALLALLLFGFTIPNACYSRTGVVYDTRNNNYLGSFSVQSKCYDKQVEMTLSMYAQNHMPVPIQYVAITEDLDFVRTSIVRCRPDFYSNSTTFTSTSMPASTPIPSIPLLSSTPFKPPMLTSSNIESVRKYNFKLLRRSNYEIADFPGAFVFATDVLVKKVYLAKK